MGFVGSTPIAQYVYGRATNNGKRAQCFGGAKKPHGHHARRRHGQGGGRADRRRLRLGGRALHGDLGRRSLGEATADALVEKLIPRVEKLKVGLSTDREADYGPLVTKEALARVKGYIDIGVKEGATLKVDGRGFAMQGYENGYFLGGTLFDNVTKDMRIYKEEIFGPVLSVVARQDL